jgi:ATP-binding cassette ChvD family protein
VPFRPVGIERVPKGPPDLAKGFHEIAAHDRSRWLFCAAASFTPRFGRVSEGAALPQIVGVKSLKFGAKSSLPGRGCGQALRNLAVIASSGGAGGVPRPGALPCPTVLALDEPDRYISAAFPKSAPSGDRVRERLSGGASERIERPMARQFIYHMQGLSKTYPGNRKVLENIHLSFYPDAKIGVLGVNGSGKSTLLRIMAGLDEEFSGEAWVAEGATVGYLAQEPQVDPAKSVRDNVMEGVAAQRAILDRYNELAANYSDETADEMTKLQDEIEAKDLWDLDSKVDQAMDALRCPADGADVAQLSGGEKRRVALCQLLLAQPDLLLLDEPTNHLDAESVMWLEGHLRNYPGAILIVTHDRYFLDNVTGWILELDRGRGIPYEGNYSAWLGQKQKRLQQEGREEEARQRTLTREQEWIAASPRARQAKSKARYQRYEELLAKAADKAPQTAQIVIPVAERLGQNVIDFEHLRKGFGNNLLIDDLTFKLPAGGIVGIIGPNGAGKTTLFRMITGHEKADGGSIKIGESVRLGYVDQSRDTLEGGKTVWEEISGGLDQLQLGKREVNSRAYCAAFNFKGADQQKKVGSLSGGERNRVHLAKMLKSGANVLLLDEPTNDLDVDTLRALEEALEDFAGCAVITSHDRWLLDRIATHILAFEGDSHVEWFEGNFQDYEEDKKRRLGVDSTIPTRIKYKKFSR